MTFPRNSCRLWHNVEKYGRGLAGHRWQHDTTHALFVLDNQGYKHTLRICNTFCFSTAKMVARTRLNVTSYVYFLSCFNKLMLQFPRAGIATCCWLDNPVFEFGQGQEIFLLSKTPRSTLDNNESSKSFCTFMICYRVSCVLCLFCKFHTAL